jgi:hypothetical protein
VPPLPANLLAVADGTKGFLPADEAAALHAAALEAPAGCWLEVGTYCGKSTVHLGDAARSAGAHLVTVDHHRGSEENQPGWEWHDATLVDPHTGRLETLPSLRRTLWDAGLDEVVSVVVGSTQQVGRWWRTPLTLLFLDGNHTEPVAQHDYEDLRPPPAAGRAAAGARRLRAAGGRRPPSLERVLPGPARGLHRRLGDRLAARAPPRLTGAAQEASDPAKICQASADLAVRLSTR